MYDEVVNSNNLDDRHRLMAILASCIAVNGVNEFKSMIQGAYQLGVSPIEIKEIVYLAVPYCGIAQVLPFLVETKRFFESNNISLPLSCQSTDDSPLKKQQEIFGKEMTQCLSFEVKNLFQSGLLKISLMIFIQEKHYLQKIKKCWQFVFYRH